MSAVVKGFFYVLFIFCFSLNAFVGTCPQAYCDDPEQNEEDYGLIAEKIHELLTQSVFPPNAPILN